MKKIFLLRLIGLVTGMLFLSWITNSYAITTLNPGSFNKAEPTMLCELVCPGDLSFTLESGACNIVVNYVVQTTGDCVPSVPVQTSGLPSGASFPIGITQNCFTIDLPPFGLPDGDTTCCFNVVVNEYPNPNFAITCNDLTFISVGENCQHCISAESILEGGPYVCYDNYVVELDKTPPFGNGPWTSGCVGASDIGKTYQVRITDPQTNNKCWGSLKVEDKLSPKLECHNISLPCNSDPNLNAAPFPAITGYQKITFSGLVDAIGEQGAPTPDIHVYSFDYGDLPVGTDVLDVNCRIKLTGHSSLSDLKIMVNAPDGTPADVFSESNCNGAAWPINVLFDDEGVGTMTLCADLNAGGDPIQCVDLGISNSTILGVFDGKDANGIWTVTISDNAAGSDGLIEIVGLEVLVDVPQKLPTDNCGGAVNLTHVDTEIAGDCTAGVTKTINRLWKATDAYGNTSTCIQHINILNQSLVDVVMPVNYDGIDAPAFLCTDTAYPTPEWIEGEGLQGWPWVSGSPVSCNMASAYQDVVIAVCEGTYKIRREWSVIDWCLGEVQMHNQIIKVIDEQSPTFVCPQNLKVSTDPFACCGTVNLPDVIITDGCSRIKSISGTVTLFDPNSGQQTGVAAIDGSLTDFPGNNLSNPDTLGAFGLTPCLPQGTHIVEYVVEDDCGNTSTCSFNLTVKDDVPPVAACDETSTIGIGVDDPLDCYGPGGPNNDPAALGACDFAGVTWVKATVFDDGSYDVCANVKFTIRRMAPYSDCILGLNATNGQVPCNDSLSGIPSEFERAIAESDSIKFYCCEAGTIQPIILRVYHLEADGNISIGANGLPLFNECIIEANVVDKTKPVCTAPPTATVTCEQLDPSLSLYGKATLEDNCCLDESINYLGQCGLAHSTDYSNFDSLCSKGTIVRTFHAFDCHGNSSSCSQEIVVNYDQDYYIRFPDDVIVTACNGTGNYGEPSFFGEDCELLATAYSDEVFPVVADACYKIERTWTIINWCTYDPTISPINVPNPNPNAIVNHPANLPGPIVSACGTQPPWSSTIVKISPTDPAATDYCSFWNANTNSYQYTQIIKIIDTTDPVFANCPSGTVTYTDNTQNDPALWHQVFNPNLPTEDLTEVETNLSITSSDDCAGANLDVAFLLFLDLDDDGTQETVINSNNLSGADTIRYNNLSTPNYLGGTPVTFDSRAVPTNQKWHFSLQNTTALNQRTSAVSWNTAQAPNTFVVPQLPFGTHKIKWIASDQCGNERVCEHIFTITEAGPTSGIETLDNEGFALYQNEPNPFSESTSIRFLLPEAAEATLSVFDAEGRLVFAKTDHFRQGISSIPLEGAGLLTTGVLYYKLESGQHVAWRKMVLIR